MEEFIGKFYINRHFLDSHIRLQHNRREPPYYYISGIERKILPDKRQVLIATFMFEGLNKYGEQVNRGWRFGYHQVPLINWRSVPLDPQDRNTAYVRAAQFEWRHFNTDDGGLRVYDIPYSKETFVAMAQHSHTSEESKLGLSFSKEDKYITVESVEQFTTEDFEDEWKKLTTPKPQVDVKQLVHELRKSDKAAEDAAGAYQ